MAGTKAFLLAALCSLVILSIFVSDTQSASCCLRYTKRQVTCSDMKGYTVQNINTSCDLPAIIFHRVLRDRVKFVCANPLKKNTQEVMKCLDEKRRQKIIAEASGIKENANSTK